MNDILYGWYGQPLTPLARVERATANRERCEIEWRETLRLATEEHSLRAVAVVAGVSHARVSQIVGRKS